MPGKLEGTEMKKEKMEKLKAGEVKVLLKNIDGINIGEYIVTDGKTHTLYSPYGNSEINTAQLKSILNLHTDITYADLAVALLV